MKNIDVVDLFDEELKKKQDKLDKKVEKMRIREEKIKRKEEKKFEKEEDQGFNEYMKKLKQERLVEMPNFKDDHINISSVEKILNEKKSDEPKKHHVSTLLIIVLSICLIVLSADYILYNATINYKNLKTLITSSILIVTVFFYILSMLIKKDGVKRFFEVLSLLSFIGYIAYQLFIA